MRSLLGAWMLTMGCLGGVGAAESDDALLAAAAKALAQGQAVAALQVLSQHPARESFGPVRVVEARAMLALGRPVDAASRVGLARPADLERWPDQMRGGVAALNGEIALASGGLVLARGYLELALRQRSGAELDRTLVLLAELCERQGDLPASERYAHLVWRDWPRSPYRARAGVLEARVIAPQRPDDARALLAGVRVQEHVDPGTRLSAAELLCHLLLAGKPGQCLVVAEQELARLPSPGRLPLYRALALVALDPAEGLVAIARLDPALRQDPAAQATEARLRASPAQVQQASTQRIERARVELELGRMEQARTMLEPLVGEHPAALILFTTIPGVQLDAWLQSPSMRDPTARVAVAIALARRGDRARAWPLFAPTLADEMAQNVGVDRASVWYWAARSAPAEQAASAEALRQRLLALAGEGVEIGLTWADEAQRRERLGVPAEDVRQAWERAGVALPRDHVWQPVALLRAARPLVADGKDLPAAQALLERVVVESGDEERRRCRFLLAQVYERQKRPDLALRIVEELRPFAAVDQAEKLERMRERLQLAVATEVQSRPLDAEN